MLQLKFVAVLAFLLASSAYENHIKIEPRIVQGHDALEGQFPYYAFLRILLRHEQNVCGGSLISNTWILTTAHCLKNALAIQVYLGALSTIDIGEVGRELITIQSSLIDHHVFAHPKYRSSLRLK